jgi:hypothetical protein
MLAIALENIGTGSTGTFLLKGFVSTDFLDISSPVEGEPIYMQFDTGSQTGRMCNAPAWNGTPTSDTWRCVGYLFMSTVVTSGGLNIIRFDPSTDYIY